MEIIQQSEAKEQKLKRYYTGVPCKNGHQSSRSVATGSCIECSRDQRARFIDRVGDDYYSSKSKQHYEAHKQEYIGRAKQWNDDHPDIVKTIRDRNNKEFRENNPEYFKQWWADNPGAAKMYGERQYTRDARRTWNQNNKGLKNYYTRLRQKAIKQATPHWADLDEIKAIYILCDSITQSTKIEHHVDHIVPILGKNVRGLHVSWNLQILPKNENLAKSNKHDSD